MIIGKRIRVRGVVQGVGFRPTVWHIARQHGLTGRVLNDGEGVLVDAWGTVDQLDEFVSTLNREPPPLARIDSIEQQQLDAPAATDFLIVESQHCGSHTGIVADAASCQSCIEESLDAGNRRYRYPFSNCTHCGPRLTIIDGIPYDRASTSMAEFMLCADCRQEYENPADRRFHAQPNACPVCGPKVWLQPVPEPGTAIDDLQACCVLLQQGYILAIKGLGGFHLTCDATNVETVARLRARKHRYAKPFALMARDLNVIQQYCKVSHLEAQLLSSAEAPIVLLETKPGGGASAAIAAEVAPGLTTLGFMLPYTPLHHLILQSIDFPIVMTSGNQSDIPQCTDNDEAVRQLEGIADFWLLHDRDIRNRVDDSVARVVCGESRLLRRARGYAPASVPLPPGFEQSPDVLAFGGELNNTFCMVKDGRAILSQHMGDLENTSTYLDYQKNLKLYKLLFDHRPTALAIDAHPEYLSSKLGLHQGDEEHLPLFKVQHHHAHIAACLAENAWPLNAGKVLGVALDGLGFGDNGDLWGGEFLLADYYSSQRKGSFKPVALPGGSQAMREPWRNTYSHLMAAMGWQELATRYHDLELLVFLNKKPLATLNTMLAKQLNSPLASSAGRLFDAVAGAVGLCRNKVFYEGQAAIELEALVTSTLLTEQENKAYPFTINTPAESELPMVDPTAMWQALLFDLKKSTPIEVIATRFHQGLAEGICSMVNQLCNENGVRAVDTVVLSGGVFQNRILFERVQQQLEIRGYRILSHSKVPANDGGIALGQATVALARLLNTNMNG